MRRAAVALAACLLSILVGPVAPAAARTPLAAAPPASGSAAAPSQQYLDAMAHAADRPDLLPFRPVSVPLGHATTATGTTGATGGGAPDMSPARVAAAVRPQAVVKSNGLRREVFGFLPYWELATSDLTLNWSVLATIAYFGLGANSDGTLVTTDAGWAGWKSGNLTTVIDQAHQHATRVVLSVERFGWTSAQLAASRALLGSASARATLVRQVVSAVVARGVDGVNLDFEPIPSGQGAAFVTLVRQLRGALDAARPGYTLTFDAMAGADGYDITALTAPGAADAVFIMGYDLRTASAGKAGSVDPLNGPAYDLQDAVTRYLGLTDASHVILGLPYYGRAWTTTSNVPNAVTVKDGHSVAVDYADAVALAAQYGRRWDPIEMSPFVVYQRSLCSGCAPVWRELYYDDAQSLGLRYDLANRMGLRGVGMWTLGKDGSLPDLYAALAAKFLRDTTPPEAGIVALPEAVDDPSIPVTWTAVDDWSGVASYDVQVSIDGGPWAPWLTRTAKTSGTYTGHDGHGYAFRVRATDGKGNAGTWDAMSTWTAVPALVNGGFARVIQGPLNMRAAAGATSQVLGQVQTGQVIAITGDPVVGTDGYTWYRATAPVTEWDPVNAVHTGIWFAGSGNGQQFLQARQSPNAVAVNTEIGSLAFTPTDTPGGPPAALPPGQSPGFSPNGDGRADALRIAYRLRNPLTSLQLQVIRASDLAPLGSVPLPGTQSGDQVFAWDGRINGRAVPDGTVYLQLVGQAGGSTFYGPGRDLEDPIIQTQARVVVDTMPPSVSQPARSSAAFSPNGDGSLDTEHVTATGGTGAVGWTVAVLDASGASLRTWSGAGTAIAATWDGTDAGGARVADGAYDLAVSAIDGYGNTVTATVPVTVDTAPVTGTFAMLASGVRPGSAVAVSPNGDGIADAVTFAWSAVRPVAGTLRIQSGSRVRWTATIAAATGGRVTWTGVDASRDPLPDGTYTVVLTLGDAAGNRFTQRVPLVVDRIVRSLAASPNRFYPQDGDALVRTTRVSFVMTRPGTTTLRILDASGRVVRTAWTARRTLAGTATWTFDGRDATGRWLPQGDYGIQLVTSDPIGKVVVTKPLTVGAFMVRTSLSGSGASATLVVDAWSSEPLRGRASITLTLAGGLVVAGSAVVAGPGHDRVTFTGAELAGSGTLTISGVDSAGGSNRYALTVSFP